MRALQDLADEVFVHHAVQEYIVRLVMATREVSTVAPDLTGAVEVGASPRGTLGLVRSARALAVLRRRDYVLPQDVADVAVDVLAHRIVLGFEALADGVRARDVIGRIVAAVPPPRIAPSQAETAVHPTVPLPQNLSHQPVSHQQTPYRPAPQPVSPQPAPAQPVSAQPATPTDPRDEKEGDVA